jgi:nifR3 family TIM-barrel protein
VPAKHAHALLSKARQQLERAVGALIVARTGRADCPELDGLLTGWDGGLTVLLRKRVARHVDSCAACGERKRRDVSAQALLAATPLLAAPVALRDQVLATGSASGLGPVQAMIAARAGRFDRSGFPVPLGAYQAGSDAHGRPDAVADDRAASPSHHRADRAHPRSTALGCLDRCRPIDDAGPDPAFGDNGRIMTTTTDLDTAPTASAELALGPLRISPPVVLAPMAGITNAAFRRLCAEQGAGLYVCEMITSRGIVERDEKTLSMLVFAAAEDVRSVQLYGVDPYYVSEAVKVLAGSYGVAHVDLNFGCPVPKVTRKGGGAALPYKRGLLARILRSAVAAAEPYGIPVTMKTRMGIDEHNLTYLDAGRIAEDAGCAAIALHGRTAAQHYSGAADWASIDRLKEHVSIPVLGNGDIWEAADALRLVERTGADGVVVGRGCLGRPWLFRDLAAAFAGAPSPPLPVLGEVAAMMRRHAELLTELMGEERGLRDMRKHMAWYLKGFVVGQDTRAALGLASSLAELDALLVGLDPDQPFPDSEIGVPRGRQGSPRTVALPAGWLDDQDGVGNDLAAAELGISGG